MPNTTNEVVVPLDMFLMAYKLIAARGTAGIPSGTLYAVMMGSLSLEGYNAMIALMVRSGLIRSEHHLLTATLAI